MTENATALTSRRFLILHGWMNRRPAGHWQHWLADRLTEQGHTVDYPQLPDPDEPKLEEWLTALRGQLGKQGAEAGSAGAGAQELTVVCHSLACLLWLHAVARGAVSVAVERVLLVAPPSPSGLAQPTAEFMPPQGIAAQLAAAATYTRLVASDNDHYSPEGVAAAYAEPLDLPVDLLSGEAHLDLAAGYGSWPSVLDWCLAAPGASHDMPIGPRTP